MDLNTLLDTVKTAPDTIQFNDVIACVDDNYLFTPTKFVNGNTVNEANQNNGSCKIFAFAQLNQLTAQQTLALFGDFYRNDVLLHPTNDDHQNIRNFMQFGWKGIEFSAQALAVK